jgi:hypothetical protein
MTTNDINALQFHYSNALQDFNDAKAKEESDGFEIEDTLSRLEADGFIQGLEFGALAGFRHAIALLNAEQFTEHAQILESQLTEITKIFGVTE